MWNRDSDPSTCRDNTKVGVVISRSPNRYVDELRHRESENLPEEVAHECMKDKDQEQSQGERSDDRIPMHDRSWNTKSRNLSVNWYDMKNRSKERQMGQLIGNSQVRSSDSNSEEMEGAISLIEIGSTSCGKEATRQYSSVVRILATNYCTFEPLKDTDVVPKWKEFVFHRGFSFKLTSILNAGPTAGGREGRETRHTVFFTPLNPWGNEIEEEF